MLKRLLVFTFCFFVPIEVFHGQGSLVESHLGMNNPQVVDGATNPELIPDSTAYRLFFVAVGLGSNPSEEDIARQTAQLTNIGLSDADKNAVAMLVNNFRADYQAAIDAYNANATTIQSNGQIPDAAQFMRERDALVDAACNKLSSIMTASGLTQLNDHIQKEKKNMKLVKPISQN